MRTPPPIRIHSRYSWKKWPAALKDAPRLTKTAVKPAMKASECKRMRERSKTETSEVSRSTDIPVTKERYEGKRGRTQGERNEKRPAENATTTPSDSATGRAVLQQRLDVGEGRLPVPVARPQGDAAHHAAAVDDEG